MEKCEPHEKAGVRGRFSFDRRLNKNIILYQFSNMFMVAIKKTEKKMFSLVIQGRMRGLF